MRADTDEGCFVRTLAGIEHSGLVVRLEET